MADAGDDISAAMNNDAKQALQDLLRNLRSQGAARGTTFREKLEQAVADQRAQRMLDEARRARAEEEQGEEAELERDTVVVDGEECAYEAVYLAPDDERAYLAMLDEEGIEHIPAVVLGASVAPIEGTTCHILPYRSDAPTIHAPGSRVDHVIGRPSLAQVLEARPHLREVIELNGYEFAAQRADLAGALGTGAVAASRATGAAPVRFGVRTLPFDPECSYIRNILKGAGIACALEAVSDDTAWISVDGSQAPETLALIEHQIATAKGVGEDRIIGLDALRAAAEEIVEPVCAKELLPVLRVADECAAEEVCEALKLCDVGYEAAREDGITYVMVTDADYPAKVAGEGRLAALIEDGGSREVAQAVAARRAAHQAALKAGGTTTRDAAREHRASRQGHRTPERDRAEGREMARAATQDEPVRNKVASK